jgi:hypothetical protein
VIGDGKQLVALVYGETREAQAANAKVVAAGLLLLEAAKDLAGETCRTFGAEDIEPGCCAPCRARRAVAAATT